MFRKVSADRIKKNEIGRALASWGENTEDCLVVPVTTSS